MLRKTLFLWSILTLLILPFDFHLSRIGLNFPGVETFLVLLVGGAFLLWEILIIKEGKVSPVHIWSIDLLILLLFCGYLFSSIRISPVRIWSLKYTLRLFGFSFIYYALLNFSTDKKRLWLLALALVSGGAAAGLLALSQPFLSEGAVIAIQNFFENTAANPSQTNGPFVSMYPLVLFLCALLPVAGAGSIENYREKKWPDFTAWVSTFIIMAGCLIKLGLENSLYSLFIDPQIPYLQVWERALQEFLKHPFKGIGVDLFACPFLRTPPSTLRVHNQFLDILVSVGIFGFLFFSLFLFISLKFIYKGVGKRAWPKNNFYLRRGLGGGLILFCGLSLFHDYLAVHETIALFWALLGLGVKAALLDKEDAAQYTPEI